MEQSKFKPDPNGMLVLREKNFHAAVKQMVEAMKEGFELLEAPHSDVIADYYRIFMFKTPEQKKAGRPTKQVK